MQVFGEYAQVEVVELVNDGSGLAFGIVGGRSSGVVVKSVLPGGVADRDGRLRPGDMLLRIGSVCIVGMCARQAAAVLRQCGTCVRLLVARPATGGLQLEPTPRVQVVPSRLLTEPDELERRLSEAGHEGFCAFYDDTPQPDPTIIEERMLMKPVASIVAVVPRGALSSPLRPPNLIIPVVEEIKPMRLPLDMAIRGTNQPETLSYEVDLNKDSALGLGITVAGYVCEEEELSGIFVKSISQCSSADLSGKIQINDRIVEVDGVSLNGVTNHKAVSILRDAKGPIVRLKAMRYLRGAGFEKLQRALAAQEGRTIVAPPSPSVTSLAKYTFSVYEESTVIDPDQYSEAQHPVSPSSPSEEIVFGAEDESAQAEIRSIQDKWRDLLSKEQEWPGYPRGFDVVVTTIMRSKTTGLGISLEGTVKVIAGQEVQARHFIRAIAPDGPVDKLGQLRVGDELVEVNNWKVLGAHHVEVVSKLRAVRSPVTLVCVRAKQDDTKRTYVKNYLGGSLQDVLLPPVRLIKAKSESSVATFCGSSSVTEHDEFCPEALNRDRSRSLEPLSGLAMWSDRVTYIDLVKEDRGLGFSILDYLDPSEPGSSVIVVRSVVAGGAASAQGLLSAGDRLLSVNGVQVGKATLAEAVKALKGAPKGIVTIGVAKPLSCSTVVGGQGINEPSQSSQEFINSIASDDQTTVDSFHECLQEYCESLEVVHICLEPDQSAKKVPKLDNQNVELNNENKSKSEDSIDQDDITITEDPRDFPVVRSKSSDCVETKLSKENSKELSTSDEMVFAVTPTGLERISFDKYWKGAREDLTANSDDTSFYDATNKSHSLLFIDHDNDGYETCLEDLPKIDVRKNPNTKNNQIPIKQRSDRPYLQEHKVKQMQSLRIEPLNINIARKKEKKIECVEYYNDKEECLEEYKKQKRLEEDRKQKEETEKRFKANLALMEKNLLLKRQEPSEESTDFELECHKCFLDNYAKACQLAESKACKYCAVLRDLLEGKKVLVERRMSAPVVGVDSLSSTTDDEDLLIIPVANNRRRSAEPIRFPAETYRSTTKPRMTVTASPDRLMMAQRWGQSRQVTLKRTHGAPLGVSIVGGKVDIVSNQNDQDEDEKTLFGIFIKNVVPGSPAGESGKLSIGDRILEVDGVCVRNSSHERAVELIRGAGDTLVLTVQSLVAWNDTGVSPTPSKTGKKDQDPNGTPEHEIKITVTPDPENATTKSADSDSESSEEEDERDLGGRTYSEKGVEIDRASAGAIRRSKEEKEADPEQEDDFGYTTNKIKKKYASLGDSVLAVKIEKSSKAGLGISLAGHRDRSRMAVFICGLNPSGAASKAKPSIKLGDEILEVNGIVLHGRCHLNASAIIKGLAGPIFKIILLRRKQALEDVAVKPVTQFPVAIDENAEDRFSGYKGVHNVSIKKGPTSLGIMIVEGRHADVGQGIFISDVQQGSAAEQAGLRIGDMILAVNNDSLLGCSYDMAAATLKRTEGVVVLTVCNPNKKDDSPTHEAAAATGVAGASKLPSRPASRNQTPDPSCSKPVSRPQTPKPEPIADPATAVIQPNKETIIEIATNNKSLGLMLLGGSDTMVNGPAAVILEVYSQGAAGRDGRLKAGDYIVECNGVPITKEMTHERVCLTIKQVAPKIKMTVYRPEPLHYTEVEAEVTKKSGKGLGLGIMAKTPPPGVYISDIMAGGAVDLIGRFARGDLIVMVDGQDISNSDHEEATAICKLAGPKTVIKCKRFKIVR